MSEPQEPLENLEQQQSLDQSQDVNERIEIGKTRFKKATSLLEDCILLRLERHERDKERHELSKLKTIETAEVIEQMTENVISIIGAVDPEALEKMNEPEPAPVEELSQEQEPENAELRE